MVIRFQILLGKCGFNEYTSRLMMLREPRQLSRNSYPQDPTCRGPTEFLSLLFGLDPLIDERSIWQVPLVRRINTLEDINGTSFYFLEDITNIHAYDSQKD